MNRAVELPDGYIFQMEKRPSDLSALMESIVRGAAFLAPSQIAVTVEAKDGSFWVRIRGSQEVKRFLKERIVNRGRHEPACS